MKKEIKDYLHFYLGCDVLMIFMGEEIVFRTVTIGVNGGCFATGTSKDGKTVNSHGRIDDAKLLLRPLSDMTKEELQECGNLVYDFSDDDSGMDLNNHRPDDFLLTTSEQFHWLIQRHFDVFGLIESGLAIDKTKITNNE